MKSGPDTISATTRRMPYPRIRYRHVKGSPYPTLVIFAGLHGNEKSSLEALDLLEESGRLSADRLHGNLYVFAGNRKALLLNRRFVNKDLNRLWTAENLDLVRNSPPETWPPIHELEELRELDEDIEKICAKHGESPLVFLDLHTTSAESCAFLPFNDTLDNRRLAEKFPLPLILGIEEYLMGPLMSHINDLGYTALGFEAGRHDAPESVKRHAAFVELMMHYVGIARLGDDEIQAFEESLRCEDEVSPGFYEIIHRHEVLPLDGFEMKPGFYNFHTLTRGELLAKDKAGELRANTSGRIFMPLYQSEGSDGFFIVRRVSPFWLWLSAWLRRLGLANWITLVPGIRSVPGDKPMYSVNPKAIHFMHRQMLHLLGFRFIPLQSDSGRAILIRRDGN